MSYISSSELREKFLKFFESKNHQRLESASLIPNDPQLMFTVAGMVPFKPIFWGIMEPTYKRVTTCQKCIRTNDIENVGRTARHQTFFEMLGNFSFGDYFKKEALQWAWEFLTVELKIPEEKLWPSVYFEDEEAYDIWKNVIKVPEHKIMKFDKSENWWGPAGPSGPCGPCSEIYYDTENTENCDCKEECTPKTDCGRYVEIWNVVFTEYYSDENGNLTPLAKKNIDTGAGFERIVAALQGVKNNFDSDLFKEIIEKIETVINVEYKANEKSDVSIKVIADHTRAATFLIAEGILPSNEGRGYVLRRIIRRALRHGNLLGKKDPFLLEIVDAVVDKMGNIYPELIEKKDFIKKIILSEEERFLETLEKGLEKLNHLIETSQNNILSGDKVFELYDTFGFPLDIVKDIADEKGLEVDEKGFDESMQIQRKKARSALGDKEYEKTNPAYKKVGEELKTTQFIGYDTFESTENLEYIIKGDTIIKTAEENEEVELIFSKTPFYPEKGGQIFDKGLIFNNSFKAEVTDVKVVYNEVISHKVKILSGKINENELCTLSIDMNVRNDVRKNHTATHLLHSTLKKVCGEHVKQAGSYVEPERLRFDFTHYEGLSKDQISEIEAIINYEIIKAVNVETIEKSLEEAKNMNVTALFEEKYGDKVRIVKIDNFSQELCGGTHVSNTGEIGLFKILSETSVSAGVRRIEAITGKKAFEYIQKIENDLHKAYSILETTEKDFESKLLNLISKNKEMEKIIKNLETKLASSDLDKYLNNFKLIKDTKVCTAVFNDLDKEVHREITDNLMQKLETGVVVIFNKNDKATFAVKVSKDKLKDFHAGNIAKKIAQYLGGGGGGRPDFAQAGGKDLEKINEVINKIEEFL